jgi:hypothetical protein
MLPLHLPFLRVLYLAFLWAPSFPSSFFAIYLSLDHDSRPLSYLSSPSLLGKTPQGEATCLARISKIETKRARGS